MSSMDAELHRSLVWTLANDVSDLDLFFEASQYVFDEVFCRYLALFNVIVEALSVR